MLKEFFISIGVAFKSAGKIFGYFQEKKRKKKADEKVDAIVSNNEYDNKYGR